MMEKISEYAKRISENGDLHYCWEEEEVREVKERTMLSSLLLERQLRLSSSAIWELRVGDKWKDPNL